MKKAILIVLLFVSGAAIAQDYPDYGLTKLRLTDSGRTIEVEVNPVKRAPTVKTDLFYYWYSANQVHVTQGGYSGQLLNGHYLAYYSDKNLKQEGMFKKGLKDGVWKAWDRKGKLTETLKWKDGVIVAESQPIWKKIPFLRKNTKQSTQEPKPATGQ